MLRKIKMRGKREWNESGDKTGRRIFRALAKEEGEDWRVIVDMIEGEDDDKEEVRYEEFKAMLEGKVVGMSDLLEGIKRRAKEERKGNRGAMELFKVLTIGEGNDFKLVMGVWEEEDLNDLGARYEDAIEILAE